MKRPCPAAVGSRMLQTQHEMYPRLFTGPLELSWSIRSCRRLLSAFNRLVAKTATEWRRYVVFPWDHAGELSQQATETIVHLGTEAGAARFWSESGKQSKWN
jgi:hypothetical protein